MNWTELRQELHTKQKAPAKAKVVVPARIQPQSTKDDFSIKNCILIAKTIDELTVDEKANAYDLFRNEVNREIFVSADQETRVVWLRKQMTIPD